MSSYIESKKILDEIRGKNEVMFRMAVSHLMDVGIRHLTEENVKNTIEEIKLQDDAHSFMTNNFQIQLVLMASQLAKVDHIHLLTYISREVFYMVDNFISYKRAFELLTNCVEWFECDSEECAICYNKLIEIGFDDNEIAILGLDYIIPENYVGDED